MTLPIRDRILFGFVVATIVLGAAGGARAQGVSHVTGAGINLPPEDTHIDPGTLPARSPDAHTKRVDFAATPIPVIDPTIGNGLGGVGMVTIRLDPDDRVSPPSVFGAGGLYTDSKSWAWGVGARLFLMEDRFRIVGAAGDGLANYDYYGTGQVSGDSGLFVPIALSGTAFLIEPKVRVIERLFVGPRYVHLRTSARIDTDELAESVDGSFPSLPSIPEEDAQASMAALGLRVERDSRDNQFYPRSGGVADGKLDFFSPSFGGDREYQHYEFAYQGYSGIGEKNVVAYRAVVCMVDGKAPFYGLCDFGRSKDIRGYPVGRYQDHRMIVGQAEYRRELPWRLGAVVYFGLGEVAPGFGEFTGKAILPGGGIGVRFMLAKQDHLNVRADYAWGRDSTAFYVGLLEAF